MNKEEFSFTGTGDRELHGTKYSSTGSSAGMLGVIHGMAEHRGRYENFALELVAEGYSVSTYDQMGHGETALKNNDPLGHVPLTSGWEGLVDDAKVFLDNIVPRSESVPIYLFGHSMGSFVTRSLLLEFGEKVDGVILSGTGRTSKALLKSLQPLAKLERWVRGELTNSFLMEKLLFSSHNSEFEPAETPFDWLSRDEEEVEKYLQDEFSGFNCTTGFYEAFISGMSDLVKADEPANIRKDLPILFISGEKDPVGGKEINALAKEFVESGLKKVESKIYPGARHELINETNRDEVIRDVLEWLERHPSQ